MIHYFPDQHLLLNINTKNQNQNTMKNNNSFLSVLLGASMVLLASSSSFSQTISIDAGGMQSFAVCGNGTGFLMGNSEGVPGLPGAPIASPISNIKMTTAGGAVIVKNDGTVWATVFPNPSYTQKSGLPLCKSAAKGIYATRVLANDGSVWGWGDNLWGTIGDGTIKVRTTPVKISLTGITAIASAKYSSYALKSDGTVWSNGYNDFGQLGDGTLSTRTKPVLVKGLTGIIAIAGGSKHAIALKNDGTVWTWGLNDNTQLGDGTFTSSSTAKQVPGITGVVAIAASDLSTHILKNDGTVWSWGYNKEGQLGNGSFNLASYPVKAYGLSGIVAIEAGDRHVFALKNDGTVWSWGLNNYGQLGDGTNTNRNIPVQVNGLCPGIAARMINADNVGAQDLSLNVYPSPVTGNNFNVTLNAGDFSGDALVEIYNSMGEKMYSSVTNLTSRSASPVSIDDNFSNGIYFVIVQTQDNRIDRKFVISR